VVVAFGRIFGPRFMDLFPKGGINLHPSLLPRHRGPSPLQAAILAGDDRTGVTVQFVAPELDSGAILAQEEIQLAPTTTVAELHDDLGVRGARLLVDVVTRIADGSAVAEEQDHHLATYCRKITKEDGAVTWRESAAELDRMVRAYTPWPGVRVRFRDQILHITRSAPLEGDRIGEGDPVVVPGTVVGVDNRHGILVQTTDGLLAITHLKPQTRKEMDYRSFLNGNRDVLGAVLSSV
jgi:methionyl-tRNA formyltransferase